ncbi:MAG: hypothetical protein V4664_00590 [Patescibacteria group bacterium]
MNPVRYLCFIMFTIATFFASGIFPVFGNPVAVFLATFLLVAAGLGSNQWLLFLPVGIITGQLPLFVAKGIQLTDMNAYFALATFIAWCVGIVLGNSYNGAPKRLRRQR